MNRLIIIDGDFILWRVVPNKVLSETEIMYGVSNERSFEQICKELDEYLINKVFIPTQAEFYIGYLGSPYSDQVDFRRRLFSDYKANRVYKEKPKYFIQAWKYLVLKYNFVNCGNYYIEADDACLITENSLKTQYDVIVVCQDKDLLNTEGVRYNPVKEEWITRTALEDYYLFWRSMITGDSADGVNFCPYPSNSVKPNQVML